MLKRVALCATVGALTIAVVAAVGAVFCAGTLHVPRRASASHPTAETVELVAGDGARLRAWWLHPSAPNGNCVIVMHGIADSRRGSVAFAPMFLDQGYAVLAPDSRAHGESGGSLVTYGLLEKYDVLGWARWMRDNGCGKVYGLGESLGAAVLIQAAAVEPAFAAVVAESSYSDLLTIGEYRVRQRIDLPSVVAVPLAKVVVGIGLVYARLAYDLDFRQVSPVRSTGQTSTPILLIHGLADRETPASHSQALAAANPRNRLWLVPNAKHTGASASAPDEFRARVLEWFATH